MRTVDQPEKSAFFVPKKEWELDTPKKTQLLKTFADDVFCFGTNSKSEYLAVYISKRNNNEVHCSLFLRLCNDKFYILPEEHVIQVATNEESTFGSARLKMQCLVPMRKWRIFFNGLLKEHSSDSDSSSDKYVHVKFTMIWTASADVFDFSSDMSKHLLSYTEASHDSQIRTPLVLIHKLKRIFDSYDQSGMISGTVKIEKQAEREIYLWGARSRLMGDYDGLKSGNIEEIFGNLENGSVVHLGVLTVDGLLKGFQFGYIMRSNGHLHPIDDIETDSSFSGDKNIIIKCVAGGRHYTITIHSIVPQNVKFRKGFAGQSSVSLANIETNGMKGKGFIFDGLFEEPSDLNIPLSPLRILPNIETSVTPKLLTVPFENQCCQYTELCGGKGSSLGKLYYLSGLPNLHREIPKFAVPNGIVVTTKAYQAFTKHLINDILDKFEKDVWSQTVEDVPSLCQKTVETISSMELPVAVTHSIEKELKTLFGHTLLDKAFAVRSSATGEDTEQLSAAGQMETFLGVKGIDKIFEAVKKCWASQFSFQAIEYKRGYGQRLNTPMAVVIQEMVPCETAGVIFTCDPVTGNPKFINITANWGLGESVVSGTVEPDTITLQRDIRNKLQMYSQQVGGKQTQITMDDSSGTSLITQEESKASMCCITEEEALNLGQVAINIEDIFGSPRDIEWGIVNQNIFLFQSRPVTSIDVETEFETMHFFDNYLRTENEYCTRANVGEVLPGAVSHLGSDLLMKLSELNVAAKQEILGSDSNEKPYYRKRGGTTYNHIFNGLVDGVYKFGVGQQDLAKSLIISIFGRLIDDEDIQRVAKERHHDSSKPRSLSIAAKIHMFLMPYTAGIYARIQERRLEKKGISYKTAVSSRQLLQNFALGYDFLSETLAYHLYCTISSSMWNFQMLTLLAKSNGEWSKAVFSDFSYLLSSCSNVLSADVPVAMEDLGMTISKAIDPSTFQKMDSQEAIKWLETNSSEAGLKYKQFMERHGHRCVKEFDVFSETWDMNPVPLIKSLQGIISKTNTESKKKEAESILTIISKLKTKLTFREKLKLLYILPNARRGVREREYTKSLMIKMMHKARLPLYRMAELMVHEGRIPRKEIMFFLCVEEITQLLKNRSPRLVSKAMKRWKCHSTLDKLIFPEITVGVPKPINYAEDELRNGKGVTMTGVPISQGTVKGPARVVMSVEEASIIQPGDILITYSTDIAWSPYFPLLSGLVTELGGLLSHGAVVAREFGLPCVVGLHGATQIFKSGDLVILDGNEGTLQQIELE